MLNRAIESAKGMSANARADLVKALRVDDPARMAEAVVRWLSIYRTQLAHLLTTTQVAALLEGAREVAKKLPTVPMFPAAMPPATLEPHKAIELLDKLKAMTPIERDLEIMELPPDQQQFIRQGLIAREQAPTIPPPPFEPLVPEGAMPERIHFPIIDEAARELSAKNVMSRREFDALDAAARAKAFTVAGVDAAETLTKIRDSMARNIAEGVDLESFREKILADVDEGTFLSPAHLETVFRVGVQTAFSDGQMSVLRHPFVRSGFPYAAYDAIHDDRVRHEHLAMEGYGIQGTNVYRVTDPVFQLMRPPWSWSCRCSWTPLTVRQAAERGIAEAQRWLDTGVEPTPPEFVDMPPFSPPAGFKRSIAGAPLSVQLSMMLSIDAAGHEHKGKGEGGGQFTKQSGGDAPKGKIAKITDVGKQVVTGALDLEHGAKELAKAQFAKLPDAVKVPVAGFLKLFYGTYVIAQDAVDKVGQAKGWDETTRHRVASVVTAIDCVGMKANAVAGGAVAGPLAGAAASFVPLASTAFLAFSLVTNPVLTLNAAKDAVRDYIRLRKKASDGQS